ncbi:hypothetical protein, variant [Magnaporthiopsis poae ATCC 64411]|uniref:Uncharacterized protein n=1 Tax=Magnaporthiopsis poae (strain ATCC 64411 / 73-15) TaxID=644358 RepID=A0A0C4DXF9_MAGP6|nr:hypothetical protein, variant [Magnaporthiopsis poae ATCC 64411]
MPLMSANQCGYDSDQFDRWTYLVLGLVLGLVLAAAAAVAAAAVVIVVVVVEQTAGELVHAQPAVGPLPRLVSAGDQVELVYGLGKIAVLVLVEGVTGTLPPGGASRAELCEKLDKNGLFERPGPGPDGLQCLHQVEELDREGPRGPAALVPAREQVGGVAEELSQERLDGPLGQVVGGGGVGGGGGGGSGGSIGGGGVLDGLSDLAVAAPTRKKIEVGIFHAGLRQRPLEADERAHLGRAAGLSLDVFGDGKGGWNGKGSGRAFSLKRLERKWSTLAWEFLSLAKVLCCSGVGLRRDWVKEGRNDRASNMFSLAGLTSSSYPAHLGLVR